MTNYQFIYHYKVVFSDVDLAGVMHFTKFLNLVEIAEHNFYNSLGLSMVNKNHDYINKKDYKLFSKLTMGLPKINFSIKYISPIYYEDEIKVQILIKNIRDRFIDYIFYFWNNDLKLSEGTFSVACVGEDFKICKIPSKWKQKLSIAPENI